MCFQWAILVHETYKLWINKFNTIFIIKSWDLKFVMHTHHNLTSLTNVGIKTMCFV
jgi:hypothetical protein